MEKKQNLKVIAKQLKKEMAYTRLTVSFLHQKTKSAIDFNNQTESQTIETVKKFFHNAYILNVYKSGEYLNF